MDKYKVIDLASGEEIEFTVEIQDSEIILTVTKSTPGMTIERIE